MYLQKLVIQGFKSFAKKTALEFNGGLTCVVGPNGSGKSNIVDAVRWVLGEQKASVLRGEKMENIIFSGSKSTRQLGMAEVSITIENTKDLLPTEFKEVEITRRLYRSGESEYLINKTPSRLKDINDLFLDTGIGPDSYSVIELKMVEAILNSKSDERMRLFEEAAGINKYKHRRSEAFRKLDSTAVDLNRVNDIISEIERNTNALKRQVNKAERYKILSNAIEELEIRAASLEFAAIQKKLIPLKDGLVQSEDNMQKNRTRIFKDEAEIETFKLNLTRMEDKLADIQNELMSSTDSLHQKESQNVVNQERIKALEEKIIRYSQEKEQLQRRIESLRQRVQEGEPQLIVLGEKVDSVRMKHRKQKQELEEFEKTLARRRLEVNEARMNLIELMKTISEKEKERNALETELLHLEGREEQLTEEIERLEEEDKKLASDQDIWVKKESELLIETQLVASELESNNKVKESLDLEIIQLRENRAKLENKIQSLNDQESFLSNLIETNEGYPGGVQYILNNAKSFPGVLGILSDLISVPKKFRPAVEAILGEKSFFVIVKTEHDAYQIIDQLRKGKLGQATFLVLDKFAFTVSSTSQNIPDSTSVIGKVRDLIQVPKELDPLADFLFGSYLLVDNPKNLQQIKKEIKTNDWNFATLDGEVSQPSGVIRYGRSGDGDSVNAICRLDQLNEIQQQVVDCGKSVNVLEKQIEKQVEKTKKLDSEIENWTQKKKETEEEYQQSRINTVQKQSTKSNVKSRLDSTREEIGNVRDKISQIFERIEKLRPEIDKFAQNRRKHEDQVELLQGKLEEYETQRNRFANEVYELNVNLVKASSEFNNLEADVKRMKRTLVEFESTIVTREKELVESQVEIKHLQTDIERLFSETEEIRVRKDELLERRSRQQQEYQQLQELMSTKESTLKSIRDLSQSSIDTLQEKRLQLSEYEMRIKNIRVNIKDKYSLEITPIQAESPDEIDYIRISLDEKKERLNLFGPVNLLALEEFQKERDRLEFLKRQKSDLDEAKSTLIETIDIINQTASEKFEEVFDKIRENFQKNFSVFFEGGEGDLRILFDKDDPLSAKIMIMARPSGKRLGAIELLSGGEKALTAISLLFSIYQVKPSPFCILDEVDSPLDDLNVQRFLRVLRKFSDHTQFILVTHNKITMEAADFIYGVTMQEEGVSKLVSVELVKEKMESEQLNKSN